MDIMQFGMNIFLIFFPFLFALCFHEYAHGWVAKLKGDNTAEMMGRLTLNPLVHMDIVGTLVLPLISIFSISSGGPSFFFGWAKPVPVSARNLKNVKNDMFWIALAGPLSNLLLALIAAFVYVLVVTRVAPDMQEIVKKLFVSFLITNASLAVFNMIPLHPLDGGKVLARFLPASINYKLEQNEHISGFILLFIFISGLGAIISYPVRWIAQGLLQLAVMVFGVA
ncbi:MAG: site-2 protease family protein [Bdellovibrionaceae bacterium]|nr:site-2 protease family protein [Pseudobdellovibrionaceae bacterium]